MSTYAVILACFLILGVRSAPDCVPLDVSLYYILNEDSVTISFCHNEEFGSDKNGFTYVEAKGGCEVVLISCEFEPDESAPREANTLKISNKSFHFEEYDFTVQEKTSFELRSNKFFMRLQTTKKSRGGKFSCKATCAVAKKQEIWGSFFVN